MVAKNEIKNAKRGGKSQKMITKNRNIIVYGKKYDFMHPSM